MCKKEQNIAKCQLSPFTELPQTHWPSPEYMWDKYVIGSGLGTARNWELFRRLDIGGWRPLGMNRGPGWLPCCSGLPVPREGSRQPSPKSWEVPSPSLFPPWDNSRNQCGRDCPFFRRCKTFGFLPDNTLTLWVGELLWNNRTGNYPLQSIASRLYFNEGFLTAQVHWESFYSPSFLPTLLSSTSPCPLHSCHTPITHWFLSSPPCFQILLIPMPGMPFYSPFHLLISYTSIKTQIQMALTEKLLIPGADQWGLLWCSCINLYRLLLELTYTVIQQIFLWHLLCIQYCFGHSEYSWKQARWDPCYCGAYAGCWVGGGVQDWKWEK